MPEATPPAGNEPSGTPAGGSQEAKSTEAQATDLTKLTGDQLKTVLENPELYKLPRIAEALEAAKELKTLKADQQKQTEASLVEQKKFEELATERGTQIETLQKQIATQAQNQALTNKLFTLNVIDLEAALALIDRSGLSVDDAGQVQGIDAAVQSLQEGKAYLFGNGTTKQPVGAAPNAQPTPGVQSGEFKYKRSQLSDAAFFKANEADIMDAFNKGLIDPDN